MAYIVVEASVRTHWKFLQAGPDASWLWLCGLGYCQDGLTDGFIPRSAIGFLGVKTATAVKLAPRLVEVRLWELILDGQSLTGWQMHDYLDHNKPASEIRRLMKVRGDGGKLGGRPRKTSEVHPENLQGSPGKPSDEKGHNHIQNPLLSGTTGTTDRDGTGDAPASDQAPEWRQGPRSHGSALVGNHRGCFDTPAACARGLCVPAWLGQQWRQQFASDPAPDARIRAFVDAELARLPDGPIGDKPRQFWEAAWSARHGSHAPAAAGRPKVGSPEYHAHKTSDWFAECQRLHAGKCNGSAGHALQLEIDAVREARRA